VTSEHNLFIFYCCILYVAIGVFNDILTDAPVMISESSVYFTTYIGITAYVRRLVCSQVDTPITELIRARKADDELTILSENNASALVIANQLYVRSDLKAMKYDAISGIVSQLGYQRIVQEVVVKCQPSLHPLLANYKKHPNGIIIFFSPKKVGAAQHDTLKIDEAEVGGGVDVHTHKHVAVHVHCVGRDHGRHLPQR
jgi:hypothetical protein